jgi:hypothetical protein
MKDQTSLANSVPSSSHRIAAIVLITVNVLSVLVMAHHPTASMESPVGFMQTLISIRGLNQLVHGGLIATTLINWLCLVEFSAHNLKQALIRNGILLYSLGTFAMVGAAMTNGFIITRLAEGLLQSASGLQAASPLLFQFSWAVNQTLVGFAVITMCAGIACWSLHLISGTKHARILGIAGLVMTIIQIGMQWIHHGNYDVHQMLVFVVWHSLWCIAIALLMQGKAKHANV